MRRSGSANRAARRVDEKRLLLVPSATDIFTTTPILDLCIYPFFENYLATIIVPVNNT